MNKIIGRIAVSGARTDVDFERIFQDWPKELRVSFLITQGGWELLDWPKKFSGNIGWKSRPVDLIPLVHHANEWIMDFLSKKVLKNLRKKVSIMTLGIDLMEKDSTAYPHAELVGIFDTQKARIIQWTGKSYPVSNQQNTLVRVQNLKTHFLNFRNYRLLILGCHDLNMFSHRSHANSVKNSEKWVIWHKMRNLVKVHRPNIVLHHPHSTDSPRIWQTAWSGLLTDYPTVNYWASGIYYPNGKKAPLTKVLKSTKSKSGVVDIIIKGNSKIEFRE